MIVGIDLGTTNSLVGVWQNAEVTLIPNALGKFLTPSVVGADDKGDIIVGQAARDRLVSHSDRTAANFKRYMGSDKTFAIGTKKYRSDELSAIVLRALKADAEAFLQQPVTEAIVTVPAYFNDAQRKATKAAGQMAGLKVERLLTEPTAAALAYGFATGDEDSTILVIDLGGGTLDVSLLQSFEGIMEVKATAGDVWLGGEDFTNAIAAEFLSATGMTGGKNLAALELPVQEALRRQAEVAKRTLSDNPAADVNLVYQGQTVHWTVTRDRFEQISEPILAKVRRPLERALRDGGMTPEKITRIVFAGGATRMPMFRRMVSRLFHQLPIQHINPDEVVARGACVRAGLVSKSVGLEEHVLTDVAPFTLGVGISRQTERQLVLEGVFLPIIERNTVIPASRSHVLQTIQDNQTVVQLRIYQGESRSVDENTLLGEIHLPVPRGPAGKEKVEVRFSYDTSGLLEVDATVLSNKSRDSIVIEGNPGVLSKKEIQDRLVTLAKLKVHPRDDSPNVATIARAQRLYEENLGDLRARIGQALDTFQLIVEGQDPIQIAEARTEFTQFLDVIDRSILN